MINKDYNNMINKDYNKCKKYKCNYMLSNDKSDDFIACMAEVQISKTHIVYVEDTIPENCPFILEYTLDENKS